MFQRKEKVIHLKTIDKTKLLGISDAFKALPDKKTDPWQRFLFWGWSFSMRYLLGDTPTDDDYMDKFIRDAKKFYEQFKGDPELEWLTFNLISVCREWVDWNVKKANGSKEPPAKLVWRGMTK